MRPVAFHASSNRWLPWLVNGGIAAVLRALLPITLDPGGERYRYYAMSQMFPIDHCPSFHCFRVLPPLFASLLPLQVADAFVVTGWLFQVLAGIVLFHLALKLNGSRRVAWLTVAWYWATWAPILAFNEPLLITDPVQAFWSFTVLYVLLDRRHVLAFVMLVAGAAVKESLLLIPLIYAAYSLLGGDDRRPSVVRLGVLAAAPIAAWVALRYFLHARFDYVINEDTGYVRQTYFFGVWLKNLAPWPANLRLATLYIFGSYGAGWVFSALGLRHSSRRQLALTAASIPAMVVLTLLQVPDRALASFPYAVLIPAAIFTARLPPPLASIVLLVNAAFTIRMNTTVTWLPRTPVLLGLLAVLIVVSVVLARRTGRPLDEDSRDQWSTLVPRLAWGALAVTAILGGAALWRGWTAMPPFRLALPSDAAIADDNGGTPGVSVSPDGRRIAFVGMDTSRTVRLYLRELNAASETDLEGTNGASAPFWSPDGARIGFFAAGKLKAITLDQKTVDVLANAPHPRGGAWSSRDSILYAPEATGGLYEVSGRGGQPRSVTTPDPAAPAASHRWPSFLPDGTRFLFVTSSSASAASRVHLGSLDSSLSKQLVADARSPQYADGLLVTEHDGRMWAQPFDTRRETVLGMPTTFAGRVASSPSFGRAGLSVGGTIAAITTQTARSALVSPVTYLRWYDRHGLERNEDRRDLFTSVTHHEWSDEAAEQAWARVMKVGGVWSPDGGRFAYAETLGNRIRRTSVREGRPGSADTRVLVTDVPLRAVLTSWSADGSTLLFHAQPQDEHASWDIWTLALPSGRAERAIHSPANEVQGQLSPDGHWIAYASDETGRFEIVVEPYPATGARWQVSTEGGTQPRWRGDGHELFFIVGDRILAASAIETAPSFRAGPPQELFTPTLPALQPTQLFMDYAVAPDGQHVLLNAPDGDPASGRVVLWLNWRQGLTGR